MIRNGILFLVLSLAGSPHRVFSQSVDPGETFAKAYALYSSGKRVQAKELFERTLVSKFRLADYSLYYIAAIALSEMNIDQARLYVTRLRQRFPQSIWLPSAALLRAKCDIADKNYTNALDTLRQLRGDNSLKRDIIDEALFLQAQALEGQADFSRAYALYTELRNTSPNSRWTASARKAQTRLREKFPDIFPFHTLDSLAEEADRLTRERQSTEAEILYKKLLNNTADAELRLRYLTKLAALYLATRNRNEAIPILEQIARDFPDSTEASKALYQIGQIFWNRHDNAQAFEYFKLLIEKYPTSVYVDHARYASADIHEHFGRKEEAIELYTNLQKQVQKSQVRDDAGWRLAWLYYRSGEMQSASAAFRELVAQSKDGPFATAALYWQARTAERLGDFETAKQLHRQIITSAEESYYQALSLRWLERSGNPVDDNKSAKLSPVIEPDPPVSADVTFHLSRARELTTLSLPQLAIGELDEINRRNKPDGRVRVLLMREYFHSQAYGRSLMLANQLPISRGERNLYRYPLAYWELIRQKAQERELDPYLVLSLIRQESLFDARARSPAAAIGLMQLIPPTAARVARQLGLPTPSQEILFQPEVNIALGTQYLKDLLQRYSNNWFKALAAYNAGEAAVDRWEKEIVTDDIEEFVERIPYVETRGYVKLVLRNHRMYQRLYEKQK